MPKPGSQPLSHRPAPLEAFDLKYTFDKGFSLGPLSLKLAHAEVLHLQGAPGAGKSTLLALLAGRLPWGQGRLLSFQSQQHLHEPQSLQHWRRRVGYMPDRPELPMKRSLREVLALSLVARQVNRQEGKKEIMRVLSKLGLYPCLRSRFKPSQWRSTASRRLHWLLVALWIAFS